MITNGKTIWLEINLGSIRRNIQRIQQLTGRPVMAVVKANAYGHGILEVSKAAAQAGVLFLCVARIEEALKIRNSGNSARILVMGYTQAEMVPFAIQNDISLTIADNEIVDQYQHFAQLNGGRLNIHAKIDSGMGRLGVLAENGLNFIQSIVEKPNLHLEGTFTHFACADELNSSVTDEQIRRFDHLLEEMKQKNIDPGMVHAGNSAGAVFHPAGRYDAVRPGIAIYGLNPAVNAPLPEDFEQALTWKCLLASIKNLPAGSGVGYGHRYTTTQQERIGIAAAGYADGLRRTLNNIALLRGKRIQAVGNICMDQSIWQVDNVKDASIGDEVILIGQQGDEKITAEEVAELWGTINYEVVCGLTDRVHRKFLESLD